MKEIWTSNPGVGGPNPSRCTSIFKGLSRIDLSPFSFQGHFVPLLSRLLIFQGQKKPVQFLVPASVTPQFSAYLFRYQKQNVLAPFTGFHDQPLNSSIKGTSPRIGKPFQSA